MNRRTFYDGYGMLKGRWVVLNLLIAVVVVTAGFMFGIRAVSIHYDRSKCANFAVQTGRQTKFVNYNYWSWDCLTPSKDGKWISIDNLRDLTQ